MLSFKRRGLYRVKNDTALLPEEMANNMVWQEVSYYTKWLLFIQYVRTFQTPSVNKWIQVKARAHEQTKCFNTRLVFLNNYKMRTKLEQNFNKIFLS